jgi:hypothetical protein
MRHGLSAMAIGDRPRRGLCRCPPVGLLSGAPRRANQRVCQAVLERSKRPAERGKKFLPRPSLRCLAQLSRAGKHSTSLVIPLARSPVVLLNPPDTFPNFHGALTPGMSLPTRVT